MLEERTETMRATVYYGAKDIRVEPHEEPASIGSREVLIKPLFCGICGTDLHEYAQGPIVVPSSPHPLTGATLPQILGHEFSAEVVDMGAEVDTVQTGDRVTVMPLLFCGWCYYCRRGLNHLCSRMACTGLSWAWGGLGELAVVPEYQVAPLPDSVSDLQGALVEPAAVAGYGVDRAGIIPGSTVLITGAGPIGCLTALYAVAAGARVFVSEPNPNRAALAERLDVGEVLNPMQQDVAAAVRDATRGVGVDAAIECAGNARALNTCIEAVRSRGVVVQTGLHVAPAEISPMTLAVKDVSLIGSWCYFVYEFPRIIDLIASGRYPVEKIVTAEVNMDDIVPSGFDALLDPQGDQVKVLVEVGA
jgi:(R,R)-butanediol dehydrogenase/meso-butanediol dehydrogenase/diacetyl reductase